VQKPKVDMPKVKTVPDWAYISLGDALFDTKTIELLRLCLPPLLLPYSTLVEQLRAIPRTKQLHSPKYMAVII
jgi:hypothetical protein